MSTLDKFASRLFHDSLEESFRGEKCWVTSLRTTTDETDSSPEKFYSSLSKMKENFLISTSGEHYLKNWNKWKEEVNESLVTASN